MSEKNQGEEMSVLTTPKFDKNMTDTVDASAEQYPDTDWTFLVPLKPHQLNGVEKMIKIEYEPILLEDDDDDDKKQDHEKKLNLYCTGGILFFEMGFGKTYMSLYLAAITSEKKGL